MRGHIVLETTEASGFDLPLAGGVSQTAEIWTAEGMELPLTYTREDVALMR
jgi:hypothetical protein